jgi:hypothetical protein
MLSELCITGFPVDQLSQLAQHKLWGEQLGQSAKFPWAARLFEGWVAHAADAARNPLWIRNQSFLESKLEPPWMTRRASGREEQTDVDASRSNQRGPERLDATGPGWNRCPQEPVARDAGWSDAKRCEVDTR